ncbi:hypothetical protein HDU96_009374 [Phlyctochytrium bullatum]|nr:hypothetical protein HDU96_009374 [Phlyctochytrium bullatum]
MTRKKSRNRDHVSKEDAAALESPNAESQTLPVNSTPSIDDGLASAMTELSLTPTIKGKPTKLPQQSPTPKILIVPVGVVGLGKSTLGKCLASLLPQMGHIQSDDTKKKFVGAVINALETNEVVYADKCNHLGQHRKDVTTKFKEKYPTGLVLALEWDVAWHDLDRRKQLFNLATSRIESRGENHQTLTPQQTPDYARVVNMFLNQFTPLNPKSNDDALLDAIVSIDPFSSVHHRVKDIFVALNMDPPTVDAIAAALESSSKPSDAGAGSKEGANDTPSKKKKKSKVGYYGILVDRSPLFTDKLATLFDTLRADDPTLCTLWDLMKATDRIKPHLHITLAVPKVKEHADLAARFAAQLESDGVDKGGIDLDMTAKLNAEIQEGAEPQRYMVDSWPGAGRRLTKRLAFEVAEVVFDERVMCVPVVALPEGVEGGNRHPHATIGTAAEKFKPVLSNEVLKAALDTVDSADTGKIVEDWKKLVSGVQVLRGDKYTRIKFVEPVQLNGYVAEFYF